MPIGTKTEEAAKESARQRYTRSRYNREPQYTARITRCILMGEKVGGERGREDPRPKQQQLLERAAMVAGRLLYRRAVDAVLCVSTKLHLARQLTFSLARSSSGSVR